MKTYLLLLASALALTACGDDDKPKKKKAETQQVKPTEAATPAPTPAPVAQPAPQAPAQDLTVTEPTPVALPTDAQSGYKEYIEMPAQTGTVATTPQVINTSEEISQPLPVETPPAAPNDTQAAESAPQSPAMIETVIDGKVVVQPVPEGMNLDFR